jgi:hypothetical protein
VMRQSDNLNAFRPFDKRPQIRVLAKPGLTVPVPSIQKQA